MLEGVITDHDAIRWEVLLLRQSVEKTSGDRVSELVGVAVNDDHVRSIRTIVLHELENVEEEGGDQMARQQQQRDEGEDEDRRSRRAELA